MLQDLKWPLGKQAHHQIASPVPVLIIKRPREISVVVTGLSGLETEHLGSAGEPPSRITANKVGDVRQEA